MYVSIPLCCICCISPTVVFIAKSKWSIIVKYTEKRKLFWLLALNFYAIVQKLTKDPALETEGSKNNLCIKKHLSCCNHTNCLIKYIRALLAQLFFKSLYYQDDITATAVYGYQQKQYFFYKFIFYFERSLVLIDFKNVFFGDGTERYPHSLYSC